MTLQDKINKRIRDAKYARGHWEEYAGSKLSKEAWITAHDMLLEMLSEIDMDVEGLRQRISVERDYHYDEVINTMQERYTSLSTLHRGMLDAYDHALELVGNEQRMIINHLEIDKK